MVTLALAWSGVQLARTVTWAKKDPFVLYRWLSCHVCCNGPAGPPRHVVGAVFWSDAPSPYWIWYVRAPGAWLSDALIVNCTLVPAGPLAGVADRVTVRPPEVSVAEAVWAVVVVVARAVVVVVGGLVVVVGLVVVDVVGTGAVDVVTPAAVVGPAAVPAVVGAP